MTDANQAAAPSQRSQAQPSKMELAADIIETKCNDKVARLANLGACAALGVGTFFRLKVSLENPNDKNEFSLWLLITTIYFGFFVACVFLIQLDQNSVISVQLRTYFNFLDSLFGQGLFLFFLSIILMEYQDNGEVYIGLGVIVVGCIDMYLGCDEDKKAMPSLPWSTEEIKAAGSAIQRTANNMNADVPQTEMKLQDRAQLYAERAEKAVVAEVANQALNRAQASVQNQMQNIGIGHPQQPNQQQQNYPQATADIEVANNQYGGNNYNNQPSAPYQGEVKAEKIDVESVELDDPYANAGQ